MSDVTNTVVNKNREKIKLLETKQEDIRLKVYRQVLDEFSKYDKLWNRIVQHISELDCLISLYTVSSRDGYCRPIIINSENPFLKIENVKHPTITTTTAFIPNDIIMGGMFQN